MFIFFFFFLSSDKSLSQSELLNKIPETGYTYEQQKFISHSFEAGKSKIKVPVQFRFWWRSSSVYRLHDSLTVPSHWLRGWEFSAVSFWRTLIPFVRTLPSWPKHLPKVPLPQLSHRALEFQHTNGQGGAVGDTNIQTTVHSPSFNSQQIVSKLRQEEVVSQFMWVRNLNVVLEHSRCCN